MLFRSDSVELLKRCFGPAIKLNPGPLFARMCTAANKGGGENPRLQQRVLALDPGETTGVAAWVPYRPTDDGSRAPREQILLWQLGTKDLGPSYDILHKALQDWSPDHLRAEDYKVYGWKAAEHAFASLHTARWLGAIEVAAFQTDTPFTVKLAQHAKTFWTDDKLKACGIYHPGLKHARDAKRHLAHYLAFGVST